MRIIFILATAATITLVGLQPVAAQKALLQTCQANYQRCANVYRNSWNKCWNDLKSGDIGAQYPERVPSEQTAEDCGNDEALNKPGYGRGPDCGQILAQCQANAKETASRTATRHTTTTTSGTTNIKVKIPTPISPTNNLTNKSNGLVAPGVKNSLNPQPLPPGSMNSLNPQPLPPGAAGTQYRR
jgi:hypothetical protein